MSIARNRLIILAACLALPAGCGKWSPESEPVERSAEVERPALGLMTSLPLYWPLGAEMSEILNGTAEQPWQRPLLESRYELVLLDTLSPIPALSPDKPDSDPLAGLERLAVIQPRGLSPADNVALDQWVRAGGHLLLVLDPMLTGEYDLALGDPRRPVDTALIPPVVARWGLAVGFDETQERTVEYAQLPGGRVPMLMEGFSRVAGGDGGVNGCTSTAQEMKIARCEHVGKGTVTLINDAAVFEHRELAGDNGAAIAALLDFAFTLPTANP